MAVCSFCLYEPQALVKFIPFNSFELPTFRQATESKSSIGLELVLPFYSQLPDGSVQTSIQPGSVNVKLAREKEQV